MTKLAFIPVLTIALLASSCASKTEVPAQITATASADGPFFEGANSLQASYTVDLNSLVADVPLTAENLSAIAVNKVTVTLAEGDSAQWTDFSSASLQFVGNTTGMQTIAVLNPMTEMASPEINLITSDEVDAKAYFLEPSFTMVLDLDFKQDDYRSDMTVIVTLDLTVTHK